MEEEPLSDYELLRERNVRERMMLFQNLMQEIQAAAKPMAQVITPRKYVSRYYTPREEPIWTRSRSRDGYESSSTFFTPPPSPKHLIVKFPFCKRFGPDPRDDGDDDSPIQVFDETDYLPVVKKSRKPVRIRVSVDRSIPAPEEISVSDLAHVSYCSSGKSYDKAQGTTCHQCRQKTSDMKTICRSKTCSGVRGQFCGICLKNRYGEDAREALKDPKWHCPPCRGICNCSICRRRNGRSCTGILIHEAKQQGFKNVKDYLAKSHQDTSDEDK